MYFVKIKGLEQVPFLTDEKGAKEIISSFGLPEDSLKDGFSNEIISISSLVKSDLNIEKAKEQIEIRKKLENIKDKMTEIEKISADKKDELKYLKERIKPIENEFFLIKKMYEEQKQKQLLLKEEIEKDENEGRNFIINSLKSIIYNKNSPQELCSEAEKILSSKFNIKIKNGFYEFFDVFDEYEEYVREQFERDNYF